MDSIVYVQGIRFTINEGYHLHDAIVIHKTLCMAANSTGQGFRGKAYVQIMGQEHSGQIDIIRDEKRTSWLSLEDIDESISAQHDPETMDAIGDAYIEELELYMYQVSDSRMSLELLLPPFCDKNKPFKIFSR